LAFVFYCCYITKRRRGRYLKSAPDGFIEFIKSLHNAKISKDFSEPKGVIEATRILNEKKLSHHPHLAAWGPKPFGLCAANFCAKCDLSANLKI
jgi:hypothetical protein